ncbi:hypothetical protein QVD17_31050 [Tagetes erecta]|uniref:Uncharacterized protein n=1 Tax=Tagetes erecta TaxID=13708 RepID=A0AAD8K6S2_TARER|nr:hypothetical protein QVD17_31050 [Tagetes erecta]
MSPTASVSTFDSLAMCRAPIHQLLHITVELIAIIWDAFWSAVAAIQEDVQIEDNLNVLLSIACFSK